MKGFESKAHICSHAGKAINRQLQHCNYTTTNQQVPHFPVCWPLFINPSFFMNSRVTTNTVKEKTKTIGHPCQIALLITGKETHGSPHSLFLLSPLRHYHPAEAVSAFQSHPLLHILCAQRRFNLEDIFRLYRSETLSLYDCAFLRRILGRKRFSRCQFSAFFWGHEFFFWSRMDRKGGCSFYSEVKGW